MAFKRATIEFWQKLIGYKDQLFKFLDDYPRLAEKVANIKGDGRTVTVENPYRGGITISSVAVGGDGGSAGSGADLVSVKISSVVSSQVGRYNAKLYSGAIDGTATGALAEANLGTLAGSDNAIVWHTPEITLGSAKHLLKAGATYQGRMAGSTSAGLPIVLVGAMPIGETASPTTFSPSGTTAEATTWSRVSNGTPVTIALATRAYYDTTGHVLYHFTRSFSFDAAGLLISISAETQVTTDSATSCS